MPTLLRSCLRRWSYLPLLALVLVSACASSRGAAAAGSGIQVQVQNDLIPSLTVQISAATDGTTPVRLGTLVAGTEQTFTYNPTVRTGTFRLIAERPGPGGALVSEPIPFPTDGSNLLVEWELRTNNVIVR